MRKQTLSFFGLAAIAALGACSPEKSVERANGEALKVDVVAPREPEIIAASGQLSVGELANSYDHEQTMARAHASEVPVDDIGTSWNDDNWAYSEGTGPETMPKDQVQSGDPKVKVTKVPADGYEG